MTKQSSFKGRVRERMGKTGERYTAARRQLLDSAGERVPAATPSVPAAARRVSDEALIEATGRVWDAWFALLDDWGATERKHGEIARWLGAEHDVPSWWAQTLTVGYEQERGMRRPGEMPDGTFTASATKTVGVPLERLFEAFTDDGLRERWLPGDAFRVRATTPGKSVRAAWEESGSRVVVGFVDKGGAKSVAGVAHERLPDPAEAEHMKAFWRERLTALKALLEA